MKNKAITIQYGWITLGSFLFCAGLNLFIVPMGLYNGGTVGIAQITRTLLGNIIALSSQFDIAGILNFMLNIPLLVLAYKKFGRSLFLKTLFSVIAQTLFFSLIFIPQVPIIDDYLTSCIIGGLIAGLGVGIILKSGGTGGGLDILGLYFSYRYKGFSVGKLSLIVNAVIYTICALLFELPVAIYSIIYSAVYSMMIDRTHLQSINNTVIIFTKKKDLHQKIIENLHRGTTYWKATGGYTETDTYILMTVLSKYEVQQLKQLLEKEDPHCFMVVSDKQEVTGNYELRL